MKKYNFSGFTVLVVDDNPAMRRLLRGMLLSFGFGSVVEAADGRDALTLLREHHIDIVITDWVMEPIDGIRLVRTVRASRVARIRAKPIIILTAHTETYRVMAARNAGATEFLAKPISPGTLFERLLAVVERPRQFVIAGQFVGPDRRRQTLAEFAGPDRRGTGASAGVPSAPVGKGLSEEDIKALMAGVDPNQVRGTPG